MAIQKTKEQATIDLNGTKWNLVFHENNDTGSFEFHKGNIGKFKQEGEQSQSFHWWQKGNAFWIQPTTVQKHWFAVMEGETTSSTSGSGQMVVAEENSDIILVNSFVMTLNASNESK